MSPPSSARAEVGSPKQPQETQRQAWIAWVGTLVHAHRAALAGVARSEGLNPEDAFDVVQEAFQTFIGLPETEGLRHAPDEARKLLTAVTRNAARNRRRLHANARPHVSDPAVLDSLPAEAAGVEETIVAAEEHARLASCMLTLAEVPRAVVTLRMLEELPGEDVARILGMSPGQVAVLLHRAKARLLTCMASCGER